MKEAVKVVFAFNKSCNNKFKKLFPMKLNVKSEKEKCLKLQLKKKNKLQQSLFSEE